MRIGGYEIDWLAALVFFVWLTMLAGSLAYAFGV
jgi:hypothetical protein